MRFPKITQLDQDQMQVYQGAPPSGTILIMGPPGTGKTVIAFHRAMRLRALGQSPCVSMYNKVLRQYTSVRDGIAPGIEVRTAHAWVWHWWKTLTGIKGPPMLPGSKYDHDWAAIKDAALTRLTNGAPDPDVSWGHLILDEGQDFPEQMYISLHTIMEVGKAVALKPEPAVTVLADDNQRLSVQRNSSLDVIRKSLGLHASDHNVFKLRKNYRNTKPIAQFAAAFYVGVASGQPALPTTKGGLPVVSISAKNDEGKNLDAFARKIAAYAKARTEQIGVLVPKNAIRKSVVNRLAAKLAGTKIIVQTYQSGDKVVDIDFEEPGRITVLNYQSAKGLEFESVFIVDPGSLITDGSSALSAKMTLYVMCSRARSMLNLMLVKDPGSDELFKWLPKPAGNFELEDL
jgi:DNA helicase-2/ATP-dependent DNA helicase PcrA